MNSVDPAIPQVTEPTGGPKSLSYGMQRFVNLMLGIGATVAMLVVIAYLPAPDEVYFWDRFYDTGHIVVFGVTAIAMLAVANGLAPRWRRRYHYLFAVGVSMLIGWLVEVVQKYSGRTYELIDLYNDAIGVFAFAAIFAIFDRRLEDPRRGFLKRGNLAIAATALLIAGVIPFLGVCDMYKTRREIFPVLIDFQQPWDGKFYYAHGCTLERVKPPSFWPVDAAGPATVGQIDAYPGKYPGFVVVDVYPDWTAHQALEMDVYFEAEENREFVVRVHDKYHDNSVNDRFRKPVILEPGFQTIRLDLNEVRSGPMFRELSMEQIRGFGFYTSNLECGLRFFLGQIRLVD